MLELNDRVEGWCGDFGIDIMMFRMFMMFNMFGEVPFP